MDKTVTVYGDSISGNCLKVKFVADRLGIAHRWIETSVLKKETRTPAFLALNPAGQVPLAVLANGQALAQSNAIMLHLAEGSDLIPGDSVDRALMFQWLFWEQYSHETALAVLRFQRHYLEKTATDIDPNLPVRCQNVLTLMENHLATRRYFVAERLTLADIALVAYTRFAHDADIDLKRWPQVRAWVQRVEHDLNLETALPA